MRDINVKILYASHRVKGKNIVCIYAATHLNHFIDLPHLFTHKKGCRKVLRFYYYLISVDILVLYYIYGNVI